MLEQRLEESFPLPAGFYVGDEMEYEDKLSALMTHDCVFERGPSGPIPHRGVAYHFENERFVAFLEQFAESIGIKIVQDTIIDVRTGERGIESLLLESGVVASADLYVDCSGFRSLLLGKTLGERFVEYRSTLFCDRAVVGGWDRTGEVIKPYTTCETMNSGWCWQIEHETRINRGYVYASQFVTDDEAEREFREKNPKVGPTRIVRFTSGRYERNWVKNVVAIGNAAGFVEPLEATALGLHALQARDLVQTLVESCLNPQPTQIAINNQIHAHRWDSVRRFLAVHYKFNTRVQSPFWQACQNDTDLAGAEAVVDYYRENGPATYWGSALFPTNDQFGFGGYVVMLLGQKVPFRQPRSVPDYELSRWETHRRRYREAALRGAGVKDVLEAVRSGKFQWRP